MDQMDLAQRILAGEIVYITIDEEDIPMTQENLLVTMQGLEGFAFAGEGPVGVVLDTHITDELREEGFVREVLSKIQNMRKDNGFEVSDKIYMYVSGNEKLEKIISKNEEQIKKETLTVDVVYNEDKEYVECNINGEKLGVFLEVAV